MTEATLDGGAASSGGSLTTAGRRQPGGAVARVDFERNVVTVLGLPFDALTLEQAVQRIRQHALAGTRCFVSTPNLNFAAAALSDPPFRDTVLRSDLNLVDGMPLVWIARWCGTPVPERVAGADVFEALQAPAGPPIKVYLFGGPAGAAAEASAAINRRSGGMRCVGFDPAGFGSVESMSSDAQIDRINRSGADFVVASLGAKKGQAWLEHNAARLEAPVLAHLGAALNFAAGTLQRAPAWMRWSGTEWLWRIKEEPALWRRYWRDGTLILGVFFSRVLPDMVASRKHRGRHAALPSSKLQADHGTTGSTIFLSGIWDDANVELLRDALTESVARSDSLSVDLGRVDHLSGTVVALLLLAKGWFSSRGGFCIVRLNPAVEATLRRKLAADALLGRAEG